MTDQPPPQPSTEQGIQTGLPAGTPSTMIQESVPDTIPLPPLPPAPLPAPPPVAAGWTLFDGVLLLLLATLAFLLASFVATNSDFWLHLATGRAIAEGRHQFGVDPFLFGSVRDGVPVPWVNHSWLYDLGLYYLYSAFGGQGVIIFQAILAAVLLLIVVSFYGRDSSRAAVLLMAGLTLLVASQRMPVNSLVVSFVLMAALLALLARGGALGSLAEDDEPSTRALWCVPLLFVAWVNLDAWFILGLIALALVVIGNAIASAAGSRGQFVKQQVTVLIASIAACLLNPYHVGAFTFPPELAYLLGGWLPASLGSGGEALRALSQVDPDFQQAFTTPFRLPPGALTATSFTIDKIAFFVLFLLGFVSLIVVIVAVTMKDGPPLPLGRLLVFGLAVVLGSTQARLVPLFAVMAGPIIMLNFTNFGQWLRRRPGADPEARFNPNLARLVTAVLVVLALGLAWPGWLHSRIGVPSARHVAWQVQVDPSLKAAVETLAKRDAKNVFNLSLEVANYCAWFAPQVRCYVDQRYALIADEATRYGNAKLALRKDAFEILGPRQKLEDSKPPAGTAWREVLRIHKIDHLALSRYATDANANIVASMFWLDQRHWTQQYGDGFAMVFSWSPEGGGDPTALTKAINREAFGIVPEARRAPRNGADPIQGGAPLETLYLEPQSNLSLRGAQNAFMYYQYFDLIKKRWKMSYYPVWLLGHWSVPAGLSGTAPGSGLWCSTFYNVRWQERILERIPLQARDAGPPAAPMLMIRQARRSVFEQPFEAGAYQSLYLAYKTQSQELEDHWAPEKSERNNIRQIQMAAALRSFLELQPDQWEFRRELSRLYYRAHLLDAGLEQAGLALKSLEKQRRQARTAAELESLKAHEKEAVEFHKRVTLDVKRRRNDFDLQTSKLKPAQKAHIAFFAPYKTVDETNKEVLDYRGMGLALEALKQLENISPGSVPDDQMRNIHAFRFRLFMQLGQLVEANNELPEFSRSSEADGALLWYAAAVGDYEQADKALARMEEMSGPIPPLAGQLVKVRDSATALFGAIHAFELPAVARAEFTFVTGLPLLDNTKRFQLIADASRTRAAARTMRGLLALEVGDTALALEHFNEALRVVGPNLHFGDRAIAARYVELLRAQRK